LVAKTKSLILERRVEDMKKVLVVAVVLTMLLSVSAFAGLNTQGKGAVHVMDYNNRRSCTSNFPTITGCADIVFTLPAASSHAFPVFFDLVEYQGFDYALNWPGLYTCIFNSCSDMAIGDIVNPGDGISHAWYTCQTGNVAIPGFGWVEDSGMVCLVPHPTAGGPLMGDCSGGLDSPVRTFCAGIGGATGDDPCEPTAIQATTWGAIKDMFK
jgi:hypothetical protein